MGFAEDDGTGFDPVEARQVGDSLDLRSMAGHTGLLDGDLKIEINTEGTTICVEVPV